MSILKVEYWVPFFFFRFLIRWYLKLRFASNTFRTNIFKSNHCVLLLLQCLLLLLELNHFTVLAFDPSNKEKSVTAHTLGSKSNTWPNRCKDRVQGH